jgi:hypothetical protein
MSHLIVSAVAHVGEQRRINGIGLRVQRVENARYGGIVQRRSHCYHDTTKRLFLMVG